MMGWYNDGGTSWGGWVLMSVMMLAFWALVVVAIVAIFRGVNRDDRRQESPGSTSTLPTRDSLAILQERFARGEIDAEEYRARAEVLRGATGHLTSGS